MFSSRPSSPGPSLRQHARQTSNLPRRTQADNGDVQFIPPRPKSPLSFALKKFAGTTSHPASPSSAHQHPHLNSHTDDEQSYTTSSFHTAAADRHVATESTKLPRVGALFRRKSSISILSNQTATPLSDGDVRVAPSEPDLSTQHKLRTPPRKGHGHPHRRSSSYSQIAPITSAQSSPRSPPAKRRVYDGSDVQNYIRHGNQSARHADATADQDKYTGRGQGHGQTAPVGSRPSSPSPRVGERPATSLGWSADDRFREAANASGFDRTERSRMSRRYSFEGEIEDLQSSNGHDRSACNAGARPTEAPARHGKPSGEAPSFREPASSAEKSAPRRLLFERPGLGPTLARKGSKRAAPPQPLKFPSPALDIIRSSSALCHSREDSLAPFPRDDSLASPVGAAAHERTRPGSQSSSGDSPVASRTPVSKDAKSPTASAASSAPSPSRIPFYRRMRSNSGGASSLLGASSSYTSHSASTSPSSRRTLSVATARSFPKTSSASPSNAPHQAANHLRQWDSSESTHSRIGSSAAAVGKSEAGTALRSAPPDRSLASPPVSDARPSSVMALYPGRRGKSPRNVSPRPITSLEPSLHDLGSAGALPASSTPSAHRKKSPSISTTLSHSAKASPATTGPPPSSVANNLKSAGKRGWGMVRGWKEGVSTPSPANTPTRKTFDGRLDRKSRPDSSKAAAFGIDAPANVNEATRKWLSLPEAPAAHHSESIRGLIFAVPLRDAVIRTRLLSPRFDNWGQPPQGAAPNDSQANMGDDAVFVIRPTPRRRPSQIGLLDLGSDFSLTSDIFSTSPTKSSTAGAPLAVGRPALPSLDQGGASPLSSHHRKHSRRIPADRAKARRQYLPRFVTRCIESLETYGIQEEGLYRLSGRTSHTSRLRHLFDGRLDVPLSTENDFEWDLDLRTVSPVECDINSVCSVLKAYLRDLPDTLLSLQQIQQLEGEARKHASGRNIDVEAVRHALEDLEPAQWYLLREISLHLGDLISEEVVKRTKMTMMNLSLVLAPTLSIPATSLRFMVQHREMLFELGPKSDPDLDKVREGGLLGGVVAKECDESQGSGESSRASSPFTNSSFTFALDSKVATPKSFIPVATSRLQRNATPPFKAKGAATAADDAASSRAPVPATLPSSTGLLRRHADGLSVDGHSANRNSDASVATVIVPPPASESRHRATKSVLSGQAPQLSLDLDFPTLSPGPRPGSASNSDTKSHSHTNSSSTNFSSSSFSSVPPHSRESSVDTSCSTAPDVVNSRRGLDLKEIAEALPRSDEDPDGAAEPIARLCGSHIPSRSVATGPRSRFETSSFASVGGNPPYLFRRKEPQARMSPHPPVPQGLPISETSSSLHSSISASHSLSLASHAVDSERSAISPAPSIASFQTSTSGGGSGGSSVSTLDRPHPLSSSATAASQSYRGPGRLRSASTNFFASGTTWASATSGLSGAGSRIYNGEATTNANASPSSTTSSLH